jgi:hypothetical protein
MGEHFFGDLTKSLRNVSVSRKRALQVIGGALAVAAPARLPQAAEAGTRKEAFVAATVVNILDVDATTFKWQLNGAWAHPDFDTSLNFTANYDFAANAPADKVRAELVANLKRDFGALSGHDVPRDRIAVTLL